MTPRVATVALQAALYLRQQGLARINALLADAVRDDEDEPDAEPDTKDCPGACAVRAHVLDRSLSPLSDPLYIVRPLPGGVCRRCDVPPVVRSHRWTAALGRGRGGGPLGRIATRMCPPRHAWEGECGRSEGEPLTAKEYVWERSRLNASTALALPASCPSDSLLTCPSTMGAAPLPSPMGTSVRARATCKMRRR